MTINPTKDFHASSKSVSPDLTSDRIDPEGRQRISAFVYAALGWAGQNATRRFTGTGRVSQSTIERVKRGEEVSETLLRALGDVLDLPRDYLLYIGHGNTDRIERLGDDADEDLRDLIRWTLEHLFSIEPGERSA